MDLYPVDDRELLFISPDVDDWQPLQAAGITAVIDLDGGLDVGVPTMPNQMIYVYFPINDADPPDCAKLNAVGQLGAALVKAGSLHSAVELLPAAATVRTPLERA